MHRSPVQAAFILCSQLMCGACSAAEGEPSGVPPSAVPSLSLVPQVVSADGRSQVVVQVQADDLVGAATVRLQTTAGTFVPGTAQELYRVISAGDKLAVAIQAPSAPGLAIVSLQLRDRHLQDTIRFTRIGEIAELVAAADSLPADGASTVLLSARASPTVALSRIMFATTAGSLLAGSDRDTLSSLADSAGRAQVILRSSRTTGTAIVTATSGDRSLHRTVEFVRARPDAVSVVPDSISIAAGLTGEVSLKVSLARQVGSVSEGTEIDFVASRTDGTPIGIVSGSRQCDANGSVTLRFAPADTVFRGRIRFIARASTQAGATVSDTAFLEVRP